MRGQPAPARLSVSTFAPSFNEHDERRGPLAPSEFADTVAYHMARIAEDNPPKRMLRAAERVTD